MSEARTLEDVLRDPASTAEIQRAVDAFDQRDVAHRARVHVLRNFTIESCLPSLRFAGYRREVRIDTSLSGFDAYRQDALEPDGEAVNAEIVLVWLWLEWLPMAFREDGTLDATAARAELFGVIDDVAARTPAAIFVHTFLPPIGRGPSWEGHDALDALNLSIRERARSDARLVLIDVARLAADLGRAQAIDARFGLMHRAPVSNALARLWGDRVAEAIAVRAGRIRKVVVVDADETLWGGIVGEDGPRGIRLSRTTYPGNAFVAFQRQLLELKKKGILLSIASKNEPESVFEVLDGHPDSVLHRADFAATRIGWGPKSEMIRAIAEELHLGLDAFVFIDDSPVECAEVASALPMVEVIQMPREAHRVPSVLASYRGFDRSAVTREDGLRTTHHAAEREREQARAQYADLDAFLASLDLEAVVGPPSPFEIERVAQLTARTNQFNLTTRRYDLFEIESLAKSPHSLVVALRASDRHGDYGLTGLGIATVDPAPIDGESEDRSPLVRIDALLMSCRTLGRKLEDVLLSELCAAIDVRFPGARIEADYRPTKKNAQVADFYAKHGFVRGPADHPGDSRDGELAVPRTYVLAGTKPAPPSFIRIRRIP